MSHRKWMRILQHLMSCTEETYLSLIIFSNFFSLFFLLFTFYNTFCVARISLSPSPQRQVFIRLWKPLWSRGPTKSPRRGSSNRPSSQTVYYCWLWGRGVGWISGPSFILNLSDAPRSGHDLTGSSPSQLPFHKARKVQKEVNRVYANKNTVSLPISTAEESCGKTSLSVLPSPFQEPS